MPNHFRVRLAPLTIAASLAGLLALAAAWSPASAAEAGRVRAYEEAPTDRVIVKFRSSAAVRIAGVHPDKARADVDSLAARNGVSLQYIRTIYSGAHTVYLGGVKRGQELTALVAKLASDPAVEYAAPDRIKHAFLVPNDPRYGKNNDPNAQTTNQWYLLPPDSTLVSAINAEQAWDITTGSSSAPVAVLDTGALTTHPDFAASGATTKFLGGSYDMVDYDFFGSSTAANPTYYIANNNHGRSPDPSDPGDWVSPTDLAASYSALFTNAGCTSPAPSSWHGTMTAGIIGAVGNNGVGIAGIGWNTPLVAVRVLGKCAGYDSDILDGMAYAAGVPVPGPGRSSTVTVTNPNPVRVMNMSLGSTNPCTAGTYGGLVTQLRSAGVLVVAAAGNEGATVDEPANCPGAVAVGGLRHVGSKVAYSNLGPEVTISAPAGNCVNTAAGTPCLYPIVSTGNSLTEGPATQGGSTALDAAMTYNDGVSSVMYYGPTSPYPAGFTYPTAPLGTSFSTPMVTGTIGLMWAVNPSLSADQVVTLLKAAARPFPTTISEPAGTGQPVSCTAPSATTTPLGVECVCTTGTCGAGMLDVHRAVLLASGQSLPGGGGGGSSSGGGGALPLWTLLMLALRRRHARTSNCSRSDQDCPVTSA